ncbi:MAG: NUDIX hydrolase [Magnetococcales bacterium]|nr:NUDIX hydrolase [Magnetococcales bacterium]
MENEFTPSARFKVSVSAHVLILDQRLRPDSVKILLARLAYRDHRARKWSFPGGFVDQGEGLEAALKREVSEEIGLELLQCRYLETVPLLLVDSPNIGFIFLCDSWQGTPQVKSREILETAWVDEQTFWQLDREGQLAYPQMRGQTACLGWHPPPSETPPAELPPSRCLWSRMTAIKIGLALMMGLTVNPLWAGESGSSDESRNEKSEASMDQVREHLMDAMRALGKAGKLTYDSQMPAVKEKAEEAIKETQRLLRELEDRLPKPSEKKDEEEKKPTTSGATQI